MVTKIEQWQLDLVLGLNRLLEVLHDISDTVHATHVLIQQQGHETRAPAKDDDDDRMLTVEETAEFMGITKSQIYGTFKEIGPRAIRIGKRKMYRKADLRAWLDSKRDLRIHTIAASPTRVHDPRPLASGYRPHRDQPNCSGSGTEPVRTNEDGYGECRACGNRYVYKRKDGTLYKHKTPTLYF